MADEKTLEVKVTTPSQIRDVDILQLRRDPVRVPAIVAPRSGVTGEVAACFDAIKQIIETREGTRGPWVEKSVTWRDLIGSGLVQLTSDGIIYNPVPGGPGGGGGGGTNPIHPPLNPPEVPNYTPPPAPTGVYATGAMTMVLVGWNQPGYDYHGYAEIWRAESNLIGNAVLIGTSTSTLFADEVGAAVNRYYWVRFKSKWDVLGPYNATNGTLATTGADIPYLLEQLEGQITQTHLDAALSAEINQIDVLALEVSQLSAGVSGAFDPFKTYYFDTTAEGWVADTDANVSQAGGHLIVNSTGSAPSVKLNSDLNPGVAGGNYPVVKARVKRVSGSTWSGTLQWKTGGHGFSGSYQKVISDPVIAIGDYATLEWDMSADTDFNTSTVTNLRIGIGAASDDDFDIDWIASGRNAPGASVAMVGEETAARVAADEVEITQRELLAAKIIGTADPDDIDNLADLTAGLIYEEKVVRISEDAALAQDVQTLSTTVDGNTSSIQVAVASINGLEVQYTVKVDNNGYVSGFGLASTYNNATPDSTFGVRADTFYIANPTGPGVPPSMPFIVKTTNWTSAGDVSNPPGVYMVDAFIANGQIVNAKIGNLAVDDAKIANLNAAKLNAGLVHADRLDANVITGKVISVDVAKLTTGIVGGSIYSQSYASGNAGWALYQNGYADLNNVAVRGMINGGAYTNYVWPPAGNWGFHLGPYGLLLGNANNNRYFQVTYDGQVYAPGFNIINGNASFTGYVNATSGSFSGSLAAATGTFAGAVVGTAVIGTAQIADASVNTLKLGNQSVIIPVSSENPGVYYGNGNWQDVVGIAITLPDFYTKMFISFTCAMQTLGLDEVSNPINWAFRILREGTPIFYVGPANFGGRVELQSAMSFGRHWAENGPITVNFGVQFIGYTANIIAEYPYMTVMATRNS